jgi:hypothetical protein
METAASFEARFAPSSYPTVSLDYSLIFLAKIERML